MIKIILAIIIGYLLGSISPAYILGRLLKGIDIRRHGDTNAGATNTKKVLGFWPAVMVTIFDLSKGILALYIAQKLGVPESWQYAAGFAAIIGHIFPFYLGFRGGQGMATTVGLLFLALFLLLRQNLMPGIDILVLAILVLSIYLIAKRGEIVGLVAVPALAFFIFKNYGFGPLSIFVASLLLVIFIVQLMLCLKYKLLKLKPETLKVIRVWRLFLRPLATLLLAIYFYTTKTTTLTIIGSIGSIFLILDLIRLAHSGVNLFFFTRATAIFKKNEEKRFSSITLFFVAIFFTILLFNKYIATVAIIYLVFGDMFAKLFGLQYGKIKIFDKTLEGSLAFFAICLVSGYALMHYFPLSPIVIIVGAAVAAIVEILPIGINDNFSIAFFSATAMALIDKFFV